MMHLVADLVFVSHGISRIRERKRERKTTLLRLLGNEARHLARQTSQRQPEAPTASPTIRWGQSPSHKEGPLPWRPRTFIQGVLLLTYYRRPETRNAAFRSFQNSFDRISWSDRKQAYCKNWGRHSTNKICLGLFRRHFRQHLAN